MHLFDEGIFQGLWSIGFEGRPGAVRGVGATLHAVLGMPDVVAVVEADLGTVSQRLQGRKGNESRADRQWPENGHAIADGSSLMGEVIETLMTVSKGGERPRVIHVDNGTHGDPDAAAWNLACEIERYWLADHGAVHAPAPPGAPYQTERPLARKRRTASRSGHEK